LAHQTTTETSGRIVTLTRGREFRFAKKTKGQKISTKERRRVCVLDATAGRQLEHWNKSQPCYGPGCQHTHQTREEVMKMVRAGTLKWIGKGNNVAAYTEGREWRPKMSEGFEVLQLV
jgi:hypothetical protein